jgi:inorganic pyrophosphatase
LKEFFESYKKLENKVVTVPDFQGKETAQIIIQRAIEYYKSELKK